MKFSLRYLWALIPLIVVIAILVYFRDIVTYVILAWVLSMIGAPLMRFFKKFVGKNIAAILTLATFVILVTSLVSIFIPPLITQARNLADVDYNTVVRGLEEPINDWESWLEKRGLIEHTEADTAIVENAVEENPYDNQIYTDVIAIDSLISNGADSTSYGSIALVVNVHHNDINLEDKKEETVVNQNENFFDKVKKNVYNFINPSRIQQLFGSFVGFFGNLVIALMSVFFIAFFFLREHGLFGNMLSSIVPDNYVDQTLKALDDSSRMLIRYFVGVLGQITVITIFVSLALTFLGVKNALLIGFFAALMNVIPYIGPLLGAVFAVIITLTSNLELSFYSELMPLLTKVLLVFMVMQLLDNFLLQPSVFGKSVKAHPLEIFIVVLMGAKLGGILGMVLAIPAYTVLRVVARVFLSEFKIVQSITKSLDEAVEN